MSDKINRFIWFLAFFFFTINSICSQKIDSVLNIYADSFMLEKVHLHFDRSVYNNNETIYYKAYLLNDQGLSSLSKNLYIDWYDPTGKLLKQTVAPIFLSGAKGSFEIPADYSAKTVCVKAYTKWMLNFDTAFIYKRIITVHQPIDNKDRQDENVVKQVHSTRLEIYPEGGFSIAGLTDKFAFKATDAAGTPVFITGVIRNNKGQIMDSITSQHDGMGIFSLLLTSKETCYFEWISERGEKGVTKILAQKEEGAHMHVLPANKKAFYTVERSANAGEAFKTMHLLVHKNQNLRYKIDFNMAEKRSISSEVSTEDLPSGIVQFTLFNADWLPVAERIIFINNQNHSFYPEIKIIQKDLSGKGKNQLEIFVPDTLFANMSIAVTDAVTGDPDEATIFSDLLLSDEIRGKVNNPAYYFSNEGSKSSDKVKDSLLAAHLDLVMLTNGHRRFDWEKIAKGVMMDIHYPAETDYLQIKGKVTGKNVLKTKEPVTLNVMLETKDSSKIMYTIPVQRDGTLQQNNVFYYDSVKLYYSLNGKKLLNKSYSVGFENGLMTKDERKNYFPSGKILNNELPRLSAFNTNTEATYTNPLFDAQDKLKGNIISGTLKEVKVTTRVKSRKRILDDFYTSGVFAGEGNNYTVDVESDISSRGLNIWNYLQSKIPGLIVVNPGSPEPGIIWFTGNPGDVSPPALFLDEVPVTLGSLGAVDINSIAYVKAFRPPFVGAFLNGIHGAIALYSKKGYTPVSNNIPGEGLQSSFLNGYSKFKDYVQPDYGNLQLNAEPDYRPTLYFNPYALTDKNNPRITVDFYNNDISKKLRVVLEGVDAEGKMARTVTILE